MSCTVHQLGLNMLCKIRMLCAIKILSLGALHMYIPPKISYKGAMKVLQVGFGGINNVFLRHTYVP